MFYLKQNFKAQIEIEMLYFDKLMSKSLLIYSIRAISAKECLKQHYVTFLPEENVMLQFLVIGW